MDAFALPDALKFPLIGLGSLLGVLPSEPVSETGSPAGECGELSDCHDGEVVSDIFREVVSDIFREPAVCHSCPLPEWQILGQPLNRSHRLGFRQLHFQLQLR
jgi:hypothetical protein